MELQWYFHLIWVIPAIGVAIIILALWKKWTRGRTPAPTAPPPHGGGHGGHGHGPAPKKPSKLLTAFLWVVGLVVAIIPLLLVINVGLWIYDEVTTPTTDTNLARPKKWCYTPCKMRTTWSERIRSEQPVKVKYDGKDWLQISGVGNDEIPYDKFAPGLAEFISADPANPKVGVYIYAPIN